MENTSPKYKRILLKLSGEALAAGTKELVDEKFVHEIAEVLKKCLSAGIEIGVIVGAGNIWRGRQGKNMDPVRADHMGMLATSINALALQDAFERDGIDARVMTSFDIKAVAEPYIRAKAVSHLKKGRVVIFGCGLGSPFFSTDTAAALRAAEIDADVILMAKNVDGIYTADPNVDKTAKKLDFISYKDILSGGLKAIDSTATALCMDRNIPILIFGLDRAENIYRAAMGENLGTVVSNG